MSATSIPERRIDRLAMAGRTSTAYLNKLLPLLLFLALPGLAQAQFEYTITSGTVSITRYLGIGGHVIIPEAIDGLPVSSIGAKAFEANPSVTGITIPDGIMSIGDGAFEGCRSLTRVTIPNSVTRIGGRAFSDCTSLTGVTIGNSVSSIGW